MLNKESFYKQVQTTYPKAELSKALLQHDKVITKILESQATDLDSDSINKFITSCFYIDDYYFNSLKLNPLDLSLKVDITINNSKKTLTLKQTLSYAYLGLKLHLDGDAPNLKRYLTLSKDLCTKWRPYLWQKIESILD